MAETMIAYPRQWFILLAIVIESVLIYLFLVALLDKHSILRNFWLVFCPIVGIPFFALLVPPIFTTHSIGPTGLRLRMGLLIDQKLEFDHIQTVKETSTTRGGLTIGIGVRYLPIKRQLFVTSAFSNLVSLRLRKAVMVGRIRKRPVEEVILNVSFPRRLLDVLENEIDGSGER